MYMHYHNEEVRKMKGGKMVRKVTIKKGRGVKSVSHFRKGKHVRTIKKAIAKSHVSKILNGKFIPGLFNDLNSIVP